MYGAIIGDIVGSRFEFNNHLSKDFEFLSDRCYFTDDTVMTAAIADALLSPGKDLAANAVSSMQRIGRRYPDCGYGSMFYGWMFSADPKPYHSFGNGAAMRVSAVAWAAGSPEECIRMAREVTAVSHDHPEGIKGAEATAAAIYMALHGADKESIMTFIDENYYPMNFTIDGIRPHYIHNETCQDSVPQALKAFGESQSFEDCIRIAVSLGGDSDTIAAIAGGVAEAYYGIPAEMKQKARKYLPEDLRSAVDRFEKRYGTKDTLMSGGVQLAVFQPGEGA